MSARHFFPPMEWAGRGACVGMNPGVFHDDPSEKGVARAKAICATCPVQEQCLDYAIEHAMTKDYHGIWGGTTHSERRRIRRLRLLKEAG